MRVPQGLRRFLSYGNNYGSGVATFLHTSLLDSMTMGTNYAGSVTFDNLFYPWGQAWTSPIGAVFAGIPERDESIASVGLYRYYAFNQGRWMTPDPLAGDITNPQSLNHYAYVLNNPTTLVDPLGLAAGDNVCLHNPGSAACGNDVGGARALPPGAGLFGVDGIDLAAAGLLPLGPPSAALPGCGAEFATCVPYSGGPLGFDITGIHDFGGNGLDCAMGEGCEAAGITFLTLDSGTGASGPGGGSGGGSARTAACIASGLQSAFAGTATPGTTVGETGGHWNFNFTLQFSSFAAASTFSSMYAASAASGWPPPARFLPGPAVHLENLGGWSLNGGIYSIRGTSHIDLFNPNNGTGGLAGHVTVDFFAGHIVQFFGGSIDPKRCPW